MFTIEKGVKHFFTFLEKYILHIFFHLLVALLVIELSSASQSTTYQHLLIWTFFLIVTLFLKKKPVYNLKFHPVLVGIGCCLIYGICIALYLKNNLYFVARNTFGIFNYFILFMSLSFFEKKKILEALLSASILSNLIILFLAFGGGQINLDQLGTSRFLYSPLVYFCFAGFLLPLDKLFKGSGNLFTNLFWFLNFAFITLTSLVLSLSKGAILGAIVITGIYFLLNLRLSPKRTLFFLFLIAPILLVGMIKLKLFGLITSFFLNAGNSNADPRFIQGTYLWAETTFFGSGFGSYLQNGFLRDPILKYSYEATFLNYVNKLGLVSIILWSIYFYTFYLIAKSFKKDRENLYAVVALSSTMFLFMGLGNPSLFSPSSVLLHVCILLMVKENELIPKNRKGELSE